MDLSFSLLRHSRKTKDFSLSKAFRAAPVLILLFLHGCFLDNNLRDEDKGWEDFESGSQIIKDTNWYSTAANSFSIGTAGQLAGLAAIVNGTAEGIAQDSFKGKTVTLTADIDLCGSFSDSDKSYTVTVLGGGRRTFILKKASGTKWTPIGGKEHSFKGTFDGGGKTIKNMYVSSHEGYIGLFGAVGGTDTPDAPGYGTVKNFKLYGLVENTNETALATDYVGAVCGILRAGGTVSDIVNICEVHAKNTANVGGIAGFAGSPVNGAGDGKYLENPSGFNTYILRCGNEAIIQGYYKIGGIAGENAATVMYCYNRGFILPHMHGSGGGHGGIAGRNGCNNSCEEESLIAYCYNTGTITHDGTFDDDPFNPIDNIKGYGGIAGMNYGNKTGRGNTIKNCYNIGAIAKGRNRYNSICAGPDDFNVRKLLYNNYYLDCSWIHNYVVENPDYFSSCTASEYEIIKKTEAGIPVSEADFKSASALDGTILYDLGPAYVRDEANINDGYPVLFWQEGIQLPAIVSLSVSSPPDKTDYTVGETFDPEGAVFEAEFSNGRKTKVSFKDCSWDKTGALTTGDSTIVFTYSFGGASTSVEQSITVTP